MQSVPDPYRVLGVRMDSTPAEVKAAHRRLAKRHHPDSPGGDRLRFLAIQSAYQLLSDPLQRREWDARHAPGPVGAWQPAAPTRAHGRRPPGAAPGGSAPSQGGSAQRPGGEGWRDAARAAWAAEGVPWWEDTPGRARTSRAGTPAGTASPSDAAARGARHGQPRAGGQRRSGGPEAAGAEPAGAARRHGTRERGSGSGKPGAARRRGGPADARTRLESDEPGTPAGSDDTHAASHAGEPGHTDSGPARARGASRGRRQPDDAAARSRNAGGRGNRQEGARRSGAHGAATGGQDSRPPDRPGTPEMDVYSRSSGAAWSAASRAYFRRVSAEIPRGARLRRGAAPRTAPGRGAHDDPHEPPAGRDAADDPATRRSRAPDGGSAAEGTRPGPAPTTGGGIPGAGLPGGGPPGETLTGRLRTALERVRRSVGRAS
jgi:curved DNA-binding protein CbpA